MSTYSLYHSGHIVASRRRDRSLEARVESARQASEIHKRRTGRSLRVTEQDVVNEEIYEEEDDDLPMQYRRLTAHLQTGSADFNRRLSAYLTNHVAMSSALDQAVSNSYAQQYPNAPQLVHDDSSGQGNASSPARPPSDTQHGHPDPEGVAIGHQRSDQPPTRTTTPLMNGTPAISHATPMKERESPSINQGNSLTTVNPIMNDIPSPDINRYQLEETSQGLKEIIISQQRLTAEITLQNPQRMQNGSSDPQISPNGESLMQNLHRLAQESQHRDEYIAFLQRQQHTQIQSGKVTHGIPDEGSPAQNCQEPRPSQQNPYQQVKPQQSVDLVEIKYSDQQNYKAAPSEADHPREASKDYLPESDPEYRTRIKSNTPFYLNPVSSQALVDFLASTPPPSPPHPGTRTESGTPAIASAGTFFNRADTATENRGGESSSPPPFAFGRGSGSTDGPPRAQTGDSSTDRGSNTDIDKLEGSSRFADADAKRRGRAAPPGRCHSCNRAQTPEWRRGPDGARTLCNACGLRMCIPH